MNTESGFGIIWIFVVYIISESCNRKVSRISSGNYRGKSNSGAAKQASHAVSLYHELVESGAKITSEEFQPQTNKVTSDKGFQIVRELMNYFRDF